MSRVYFHSPSGEAELLGSERAWLGRLAVGPAEAAWDLDMTHGLERACDVMAMIPEVGESYIHIYWRRAVEQQALNKEFYANWKPGEMPRGHADHEPIKRFIDGLALKLRVEGVEMDVAGARLHSFNLDLNTALVAGSDPIRLAAKIHGWCESHCWVDGPHRAWLAGVIAEGLRIGLYRPGAGWDAVSALLETRDDEPVVMSYSICEPFPNAYVGDWMPPWPEGTPENWDALNEDQQQERSEREDAWCEVPADEQWRISFAGLQAKPWLQLTPESLAGVMFGPTVTVYDLFASDREERIQAACGVPA